MLPEERQTELAATVRKVLSPDPAESEDWSPSVTGWRGSGSTAAFEEFLAAIAHHGMLPDSDAVP